MMNDTQYVAKLKEVLVYISRDYDFDSEETRKKVICKLSYEADVLNGMEPDIENDEDSTYRDCDKVYLLMAWRIRLYQALIVRRYDMPRAEATSLVAI